MIKTGTILSCKCGTRCVEFIEDVEDKRFVNANSLAIFSILEDTQHFCEGCKSLVASFDGTYWKVHI